MKKKRTELNLKIPNNIKINIEGNLIKVKGEKGELSKRFHTINIIQKDDELILSSKEKGKDKLALLGTFKGDIQNMIHGVTDGITYKLKIVYSHFPMSVKVQGDQVVIDNFLGEKHPRRTSILEGVNVNIKGQDIIITGIDKEKVGQTASNIEQATRIKNMDPRVFQDGIYIVEKDGKLLK